MQTQIDVHSSFQTRLQTPWGKCRLPESARVLQSLEQQWTSDEAENKHDTEYRAQQQNHCSLAAPGKLEIN